MHASMASSALDCAARIKLPSAPANVAPAPMLAMAACSASSRVMILFACTVNEKAVVNDDEILQDGWAKRFSVRTQKNVDCLLIIL